MARVAAYTVETVPAPAVPRMRLGKLCVAIQGGTAEELFRRAESAAPETRFVEFRLDSLAKPAAALPKVKEFLEAHREATVVPTGI